ncbi:DNA-binding protein [Gryllotalpicola protaetiae]|uniref:DNA-binding protein n=1 Tax=Gryllotalpicola protaetiae TaxID=2419771 RepID=A0A387BU24_9MICO|nr:DNA-binding protein [Gryllotalpicola protaetiae]AYG04570.1 DNA-binding protein [Gryllotalpicola protaetiae]
MFVITADQIDSRRSADLVSAELERINGEHAAGLALPADRTAGDELQALTDDAATALALALQLTRTRSFHVGIGVGPVRSPLPAATREASGPAFFAARDAATRAKKSGIRLAIHSQSQPQAGSTRADDAESLLALLLIVRERRSDAGWELFDLLAAGRTQAEAAARLGISAPAASARAKAANIKAELAALPGLTRLLEQADLMTRQEQ